MRCRGQVSINIERINKWRDVKLFSSRWTCHLEIEHLRNIFRKQYCVLFYLFHKSHAWGTPHWPLIFFRGRFAPAFARIIKFTVFAAPGETGWAKPEAGKSIGGGRKFSCGSSSRIFSHFSAEIPSPCRSLPSQTNLVPRIGKSASRKKTIGFPFRVFLNRQSDGRYEIGRAKQVSERSCMRRLYFVLFDGKLSSLHGLIAPQ